MRDHLFTLWFNYFPPGGHYHGVGHQVIMCICSSQIDLTVTKDCFVSIWGLHIAKTKHHIEDKGYRRIHMCNLLTMFCLGNVPAYLTCIITNFVFYYLFKANMCFIATRNNTASSAMSINRTKMSQICCPIWDCSALKKWLSLSVSFGRIMSRLDIMYRKDCSMKLTSVVILLTCNRSVEFGIV